MASNGNGSAGDIKAQSSVARGDRMTLRKNNEEVLRKALQNEARKKCEAETKAFGECAKASGIWVVVSCRNQNSVRRIYFSHNLMSTHNYTILYYNIYKTMSACMAQHYTEEIFAKFLRDNGHPEIQPPRPSLVQQFLNVFK